MPIPYEHSPGDPLPLGATVCDEGVNFSIFSVHADLVELLLFDRHDDPEPAQVINLDARDNRTFKYWHVLVHGAVEGLIYGYRVFGPHAPEHGLRFDPDKVLVDPYAKGIVYGEGWCSDTARERGPNTSMAMKSLVVDPSHYDWEGVVPPKIDPRDRVICELRVRGYTKHVSSGVQHPGTFAGLIEKIPYLVDLGVTTVELLPVFQFDETEVRLHNPVTGERLRNFWGYNPLGFFAPHRGYYIEDWSEMRYLTGFRDLVKGLHAAGIEVILDVVYNHTGESNETGPTICFRGIENGVYYILDPHDRSRYANFSGTGNTLNSNHPIVRRMILDSLRYWVDVMHVDGFRFDLAAVMSRDENGDVMHNPPLPWEIESDPVLQHTKLIAEAWDAAGLYQVGDFPGHRWSEWNGRFRDDVRQFVHGGFGLAGAMAARLLGSPDMYEERGHEMQQSINFVTCHDGFTLNDLVSYSERHNLENGEDGRDGHATTHSFNHGVEGPTDDPEIERLRRRQIKNFLAILFLSQGTPMLLAGDEMARTQRGNNNAYCQDNDTSWVDWRRLDQYAEIHRFTKAMIAFRKAHPGLRRRKYLIGWDGRAAVTTRVRWHGVELDQPDWSESSRTLALTLTRAADDVALHIVLNAHDAPLSFAVPPSSSRRRWWRAIDTAQASPADALAPGEEILHHGSRYLVDGRSVVVLLERSRQA